MPDLPLPIDHDDLPPEERLPRLLKAARALAGFSVDELAAAIDRRGLGVGPLKAMEQGRRWPQEGELRIIARACSIPEDFFYRRFLGEDTLGYRLRRLRQSRGAKLHEVEEYLREHIQTRAAHEGIEPEELALDTVEAWESDTQLPSEFMRVTLCDLFDVSLRELVPPHGPDALEARYLREQVAYLQDLYHRAVLDQQQLRTQLDTVIGIARDSSDQTRRMERRESLAAAEARVHHARAEVAVLLSRRAEAELAWSRENPSPDTADDALSADAFAVRDALRRRTAELTEALERANARLAVAERDYVAQLGETEEAISPPGTDDRDQLAAQLERRATEARRSQQPDAPDRASRPGPRRRGRAR